MNVGWPNSPINPSIRTPFSPIYNLNSFCQDALLISCSRVAQLVEQVAVTGAGSAMDRRTYADRRTYLIEAVKKRRKKVRQMAVEFKGGKCQRCGYNRCIDALEFHHLESSKKDFGISDKGYTRSWKKIQAELDKCQLVCANCHRELHAQTQLSAERRIEKLGEFREALIRLASNG